MRVFVTGATGYIGNAAARALRRAGHQVFGLCRSEAKAAALRREEIRPVMGNLGDPLAWATLLDDCAVLVHAASDDKGDRVGLDRRAIEVMLAAGARGARPKSVVYTSGVWVYGDTGPRAVDETAPLGPARLVAWRPAHERLVLEATSVRGIVLRPACVYGLSGGMPGELFQDALDGVVRVVGDGQNYWSMIHVDDLAEAYVRAAESALAGEVFNLADRSRDTLGAMAAAAARVAGGRGHLQYIPVEEAAKKLGDYAQCLALDQHIDSSKAGRLLGWQPRHRGFVDDAEGYFEAWRAAR